LNNANPVGYRLWEALLAVAVIVFCVHACGAEARPKPRPPVDEPWVYCGLVSNVDVSVWKGDYSCAQARKAVSEGRPHNRGTHFWGRRWSVGLTSSQPKFYYSEPVSTFIGPLDSVEKYLHMGYIHDLTLESESGAIFGD
jgi:hypothetical protein